jgi:hypothetical protein
MNGWRMRDGRIVACHSISGGAGIGELVMISQFGYHVPASSPCWSENLLGRLSHVHRQETIRRLYAKFSMLNLTELRWSCMGRRIEREYRFRRCPHLMRRNSVYISSSLHSSNYIIIKIIEQIQYHSFEPFTIAKFEVK